MQSTCDIQNFPKTIAEHKMSLQNVSETFLILRTNKRDIIKDA